MHACAHGQQDSMHNNGKLHSGKRFLFEFPEAGDLTGALPFFLALLVMLLPLAQW